MNKTLLISLIILVLIVGGYLLLRGSYQQPTSPAPVEEKTLSPEERENLPPPPPEGILEIEPSVKEFIISGNEYSFNPSSITVSAGDKVKIIFRNDGERNHDLVIEELGIRTKIINSGETDTIEFEVKQPGTYTFFCSLPGHRQAGMEGKLIVE